MPVQDSSKASVRVVGSRRRPASGLCPALSAMIWSSTNRVSAERTARALSMRTSSTSPVIAKVSARLPGNPTWSASYVWSIATTRFPWLASSSTRVVPRLRSLARPCEYRTTGRRDGPRSTGAATWAWVVGRIRVPGAMACACSKYGGRRGEHPRREGVAVGRVRRVPELDHEFVGGAEVLPGVDSCVVDEVQPDGTDGVGPVGTGMVSRVGPGAEEVAVPRGWALAAVAVVSVATADAVAAASSERRQVPGSTLVQHAKM